MTNRSKLNWALFCGAFTVGLLGAVLWLREPMGPFTAESLEAATQCWRGANIVDYRIFYRMHGSEYDVTVEDGLVADVLVDGRPPLAAELDMYSIPGLFRLLQMELENIHDPHGPFAAGNTQVIARVRFHPRLGYVERYLRSVAWGLHSARPKRREVTDSRNDWYINRGQVNSE